MNRLCSERLSLVAACCVLVFTVACARPPRVEPADTLLTNGRVYTFTWDDRATLAAGRAADVTVMDMDPLVVGTAPDDLLKGHIRMTMVGGRVVFDGSR